jgi:Protein of unknown function (DUF2917)
MSWWKSDQVEATSELQLGLDATLRLVPGRRGLVLGVREGCVLVTQEGDEVDHVLVAGDEQRFSGRGVVVVWALSPSRVAADVVPGAQVRRAGAAVARAHA